ncbi:dihydrolipoyllysine-residue succinyltransferase component of 2-oxoglutarate dehydrogenase complex, mitochondrial-like [Argopecten irradians]|uniref:dihydrolipoyllysine-residue succinyltransferase component of 2-oxoglutarate dehydrogenase complex, mitochondrial-like n=1 Tax=Argopecten irradians TaxID=31199 RepID=UPI003711BD07
MRPVRFNMAAMLVQGSRCLPRYVCRLTLIRNSPWKREINTIAKEKYPLNASRQAAASLKQHENLKLLQNVSRIPVGVTSRQSFHQTAVFRDEFKIVNTPAFAESVTEGDVRWEKAVGDYVKEDDVICEIETDKTSIPVPCPASGYIEELFVPDGERVEPGQQLFKLKLSGDAPAASAEKKADEPAPAAPGAPEPAPEGASAAAAGSGPIPTTPPPVQPLPSAPTTSVPVAAIKPTPASPQSTGAPSGGARTETRVKMNRMRLRIAERLKDAQNTCAMLTTFNEVDMSNIMDMRSCYKDAFQKKYGLKLGFMSAFVKASAFALEDQPVVNAVIDDKEIVYRDYVDISVAVSTPKGLVVPVLRNVSNMNYADIELEIAALGEKARAGALAIEDMDGGTFTISNGGVFGSLFGTPIINPPQSAILGMHRIDQKAVVINGKIEIRPMMYVALTYDHRLIDGREAVTFLRKIKSAIEDPRVLLLNL